MFVPRQNEEEFCELQSVSQQLRHDVVQHCFQRQSRSMNEIKKTFNILKIMTIKNKSKLLPGDIF